MRMLNLAWPVLHFHDGTSRRGSMHSIQPHDFPGIVCSPTNPGGVSYPGPCLTFRCGNTTETAEPWQVPRRAMITAGLGRPEPPRRRDCRSPICGTPHCNAPSARLRPTTSLPRPVCRLVWRLRGAELSWTRIEFLKALYCLLRYTVASRPPRLSHPTNGEM
jgi:hypothetical protein